MKVYKRIQTRNATMENDVLKINCSRYNTLEHLSKKFKVDSGILESLLENHQDEGWVAYVHQGNEMVPFYQSSEVRTLLEHHSLKEKTFHNRERKSRWEIKDNKGSRPLTASDLTTIVDGEFYGRAEYWANHLDLQKGRISQLLDELENTDYASQIRQANTTTQRIGRRQAKIRYVNKNIMQEVVKRYDTAKILDTSIPMPENANSSEYRSANFWKYSILQESLSRSEAQKLGMTFYKKLREMPSYIKEIEGVKIRVYHRDDAIKAMTYAAKKLE